MVTVRKVSSELRVISARRSLRVHVAEIWQYRQLLGGLVRKELKVRYKNSILGFAWSMAQPAFLLGVYSFVFSVLGQGFRDFSIWLLCGLIIWTLISTTLATSVQSITLNGGLVSKVPFPRAVLPLATFGSALVHFFLQFATFVAILAIARHHVDFAYIWLLPIAVLVTAILSAGLALLLATINVWARDTQHLLDLVLLAMFWANPIIYDYYRASKWFVDHHFPSWLPLLNPFTPIIITFQRAIYGTSTVLGPGGVTRRLLPDVGPLWYLRNLSIIGVASMALLAFGLWVFDRSEGNFAEVL